jgi:hypothetical protein
MSPLMASQLRRFGSEADINFGASCHSLIQTYGATLQLFHPELFGLTDVVDRRPSTDDLEDRHLIIACLATSKADGIAACL